jgi:hypothetical protein
LAWKAVDGFGVPGVAPASNPQINDSLVLPSKNLIVIATNNGVWWSTIPATPAFGYNGYKWSTDPLVANGLFTALTTGLSDSIVCGRIGAPGSGFFVASWSGGSLNWLNTTPGYQALQLMRA